MSNLAEAGAVVVATATRRIAEAVKASGAIVEVESKSFIDIVTKVNKPLVVMAASGVVRKNYRYLVGYKGFIFFTRCKTPLELPRGIDLI
ncbi:MAG: hypothetical protein N3F08_03290 [Crenarchaeota archaeon]|nr:hypothetical protein [Thermoproteota archaeon]